MTDDQALLAAIREHPDDDTPRLAYADWLDEHGGPLDRDRAEFIRLQIELHPRRGEPETPELAARRKRAAALERRFKPRLAAPIIGKKGPLHGPHAFTNVTRGFVSRVGGHAANWVANGDRVFDLAPVTNVGIDDLTDATLAGVLASAWVARPDTLELGSAFERFLLEEGEQPAGGRPDFARFARVTLPRLKFLWFSAGRLAERGAAKVAAADPTPNVETLQFNETPLTPAAVRKLFGGKAFASVRTLHLGECGLGTPGLAALAGCRALAGVTDLGLPYHDIDADGFAALTAAAFWPTLESIKLAPARLGVEGVRALAARPHGLRELNLERCAIPAEGARVLAAGNALRGVEDLNLGTNPIGDEGLIALLGSPHVAGLRGLGVNNCGIGPAGAEALAGCPALEGLESLAIYGNPLTAAGFRALAGSPHLNRLRRLHAGTVRGKARKLLADRFGAAVRF
jgi:uncharacterized protein (TIGR02996 family)